MKTIYLAGGCFWGVQKFFDQFDGVISTEVGYANGPDAAPSYRDVCKSSGHAETVKIIYDESVISLTELLKFYFMVIDPLRQKWSVRPRRRRSERSWRSSLNRL